MTASFDVAAAVAKAMAYQLSTARLAGTARCPLPTARDDDWLDDDHAVDEPVSAEAEARADWEDEAAERRHLYDEPSDLLVDCDELPLGYDPTWWKAGL